MTCRQSTGKTQLLQSSAKSKHKQLWRKEVREYMTYVVFDSPVEVGVLQQFELGHPRVHRSIDDDGQQIFGPGVLPVSLGVVIHLLAHSIQELAQMHLWSPVLLLSMA